MELIFAIASKIDSPTGKSAKKLQLNLTENSRRNNEDETGPSTGPSTAGPLSGPSTNCSSHGDAEDPLADTHVVWYPNGKITCL